MKAILYAVLIALVAVAACGNENTAGGATVPAPKPIAANSCDADSNCEMRSGAITGNLAVTGLTTLGVINIQGYKISANGNLILVSNNSQVELSAYNGDVKIDAANTFYAFASDVRIESTEDISIDSQRVLSIEGYPVEIDGTVKIVNLPVENATGSSAYVCIGSDGHLFRSYVACS